MISRNKKGQFIKGLVPWNSGLTKETNELVKANSEWLKKNHPMLGKTPWNKGIPMKEESKQKESLNKIGKPARYINVTKIKKLKNILLKRKMSSGEKKVYEFITMNKIPLIYTGNGLHWIIGRKDNQGNHELFNPDFINLEKDKVVEVYSRWHTTVDSNIKRDKRREEVYQENGITPLIIFEEDIKKNPSIELNKIKEFI
jgi:hypothetical protein